MKNLPTDTLPRPRRQQARTADKRNLIEDVAMQLFASNGYDGVSLRDIAQGANVQLGTLFYLYREKQTLYDAVVAKAIAFFGEQVIQALQSSEDARTSFSNMVRVLVNLYSQDSPQGKIIAHEQLMGARSRLAIEGRPTFRSLHDAFYPVLEKIAGPMSMADMDRTIGLLSTMIYSAAQSYAFHAASFEVPEPSEEVRVRDIEKMILSGLLPRP